MMDFDEPCCVLCRLRNPTYILNCNDDKHKCRKNLRPSLNKNTLKTEIRKH